MVIYQPIVKSPTKPCMEVNIGKLKLKNPIITASGTFGYVDELEDFTDIQKIGAIVTKGISLKPRQGNPQPRIKELKDGLINSIGLENVGIDNFIKYKLPILKEKDITFIVNIAGFAFEEYSILGKICEENEIEAIELNVSCPNVKAGCLEFGTDPETLYSLVSSVREVYTGTLIVKLTPNVTNPIVLAKKVQEAGADAISAINTVRALSLKVNIQNGKITRQNLKGGMSGPAIKPIALNYINTIRSEVDIPIIGMGGISNINDVIEFFAVGSDAFQVGTANFIYPNLTDKLREQLEKLLVENNFKSIESLKQGVRNGN